MKKILLIFIFLLLNGWVIAQNKQKITLEDIWRDYKFYPKSVYGVNWTKDGSYYTSQNDRYIIKYSVLTQKPVDTLYGKPNAPEKYIEFDEYTLSPEEDKILLANNQEGIYRHSSKAYFYVYDIKSRTIKAIDEEKKQSYATFSPDGRLVAYTQDNNLYMLEFSTLQKKQITNSGRINQTIHGSTDWVYEEEFAFTKAFFWSPDSKKIAFYTFDESQVKEYNMHQWFGTETLYPYEYRFKYPKAGEGNSKVNISMFDVVSGKTIPIDIGAETDIYIPRVQWTQNAHILSIRRMNRLQNQLEILHADAHTGKSKVVLSEKSDTYIDLEFTDDLTYLKDGKHFIHSSEKSGFKHLYLYDLNGKLVNQITSGEWEVREVLGIDEKNKMIYFNSTEDSPMERQVYSIDFKGKIKKKLSTTKGTHEPNMSPDGKYYLDYYSASNRIPTVSLHEASTGKQIGAFLEDNATLKQRLAEYQISPKEFFSFKTSENVSLNGWMIKPQNFDAKKKYPVLMFVYGGPGNQRVIDAWDFFDYFWYQILADKGYIVVCVDNRGTGGRGESFKKMTYGHLGKYEVQDQMATAKYLAQQPYIDGNRIGIWGWSYGGYMSSLCLMIGNDVFKMAMAVAPVSTWRFYDTIYTERFLKRPQDNPEGYDEYSPLNHVDKLKGKYLLVHGTGDDNVHFQNAIELQNALIKAGKQFQSFYYPNRSHSIAGGNTRLHLYQMMTDFVLENL
jgi:dipeptidyl-peptidase 4